MCACVRVSVCVVCASVCLLGFLCEVPPVCLCVCVCLISSLCFYGSACVQVWLFVCL